MALPFSQPAVRLALAEGLGAQRVDRSDLANAQRIQQSILEPERPASPFFRLAHRYEFPGGIGGDFISFRAHRRDTISFLIADITGHGVSAGMFSPLLRFIVDQTPDALRRSPGHFLGHLDQALEGRIPCGFITAFAGTLSYDVQRQEARLAYASAAHPAALLAAPDGSVRLLQSDGDAIGLFGHSVRRERQDLLPPGHRLFAFSDGLLEQLAPDGQAFGLARIASSLSRASASSLPEAIDRALMAARRFGADREPEDDISALGVECAAPEA